MLLGVRHAWRSATTGASRRRKLVSRGASKNQNLSTTYARKNVLTNNNNNNAFTFSRRCRRSSIGSQNRITKTTTLPLTPSKLCPTWSLSNSTHTKYQGSSFNTQSLNNQIQNPRNISPRLSYHVIPRRFFSTIAPEPPSSVCSRNMIKIYILMI